MLQWIKGRHSIKFGGEQRVFLNNFWQPNYPTGSFNFSRDVTTQQPGQGLGDTDTPQGNPFATMLTGFAHDAQLNVVPAVADKSKETAFYVQDDWKVTSNLTINVGLRYEWSTPYSERQNRLQFSDFTANTGISIPVSPYAWVSGDRKYYRDHRLPHSFASQLGSGSQQLRPAPRICLSIGNKHGVEGRRRRVLRNERRHQLPVCRPRISEIGEYIISRRIITKANLLAWAFIPTRPIIRTATAHSPTGSRGHRERSMDRWRSGASATPAIWTPARRAMRKSTSGTWGFNTCFLERL